LALNIFDRSVKALARRYPLPFIKVALGSIEDLTVATIENPEINLPERRLDFVCSLRQDEREETKMLQEASIVQEWINEGLEKGKKAGKVEGEIEALKNAILEVLEERFMRVKKGISGKLSAIDDPAVLRSLHRKSVKVESLEEFARLLEEVEN